MHCTHGKEGSQMTVHQDSRVWQLAPGELVQLAGARGTHLRVTEGTLWVTLERDLRDVVVLPGGSFTIDRGGLTLVEAQGRAKVCVRGAKLDKIHTGETPRTVRARIAAWFCKAIATRRQRPLPYY